MKDKMRCASCGATFKPVKSSQTKCERCEKREREQRAAARHVDGAGQKTAVVAPQSVKITGPAAGLLGGAASVVPSAALTPPPEPGSYGMSAWREQERRERERKDQERRERERIEREQAFERERAERFAASQSNGSHAKPHGGAPVKPRQPKPERSPQAPRLPRTPKPTPPKVELTDELRAAIEARYLELAQPIEFDGIRTKIAIEMSVPKTLVKKAVSDLRARMALPSWWDLQAYTGAETDLERIRMAYVPLLPVPEVGVHKTLAEKLGMDPRTVYQGIRRIRAEMRLPQYNPPDAHGDITITTPEPPAPDAQG